MRHWRCKHQWKLVGAKYNPRPEEMRNAKASDPDLLREAIYGVTIFTQRCTECGWVATSRTAGQVELNELRGEGEVMSKGVEW